ncbi:hypothetical protein [Microbacterium sediminis]|uniref:Uncharacterized protein n=1 Tax=Microbacterium sediminis TaxID=904291 RepID=A0A1B9NE01_9MICO|nr:hypothetical protein [Microbacterium sediminis]OCG74803.1 hypothetical protein A7J15_04610 [Microbacterium sediminis]QBR75105.1 hypothetical protein E3O41_12345 [Microbacterium sediminis]
MAGEFSSDRAEVISGQVKRLEELVGVLETAHERLSGADEGQIGAVWTSDPAAAEFRQAFSNNIASGKSILTAAKVEADYMARQLLAAVDDIDETDAAQAQQLRNALNAAIKNLGV